ncbi:MAG: heme-dependent peroxidase [Chthoniobacterales bacterium]|nr:heme-dependent peroxidase [Chthoniobacterales bacterium]MDQ3118803.1 heme-dependent peroxidase [Verrucomicrobiota bacterium]
MTETNGALIPEQGWHCLHLFYHIEFGQWQLLTPEEQIAAKTRLASLVQEVRALESTQLLTLSVVTPKADLAFILITPDLHVANRIEKQLSLALGPDVLVPVYSYLSLTEESEYRTSMDEYAGILEREQNVEHGSAEFEKAIAAFDERMKHYRQERVNPTLPDWPVVCFYNMSKRRGEQRNWYTLPFEERRKLMLGHGAVGRQFAGKVKQLITGSSGLDDAEWGVTLFARDTFQIKSIVYQMRFDPVSAEYADFGEFYIALQLPLDELFRRLQL